MYICSPITHFDGSCMSFNRIGQLNSYLFPGLGRILELHM